MRAIKGSLFLSQEQVRIDLCMLRVFKSVPTLRLGTVDAEIKVPPLMGAQAYQMFLFLKAMWVRIELCMLRLLTGHLPPSTSFIPKLLRS